MNNEDTNAPCELAVKAVRCSDWLAVVSMVTYLVYIVSWESMIFVGAAYLVYWKGASAWVFALAVLMSSGAYKPSSWRKLWLGPTANHKDNPAKLSDNPAGNEKPTAEGGE